MIVGKKEFGQYKPLKYEISVSPFLSSGADGSLYASECVIPSNWISLPLQKITPYNYNTSLFQFGLPNGATKLNLPIFSFVLIRAPSKEHDGTDAIRPYTTITDVNIEGYFELIVKRYDEWGVKESPSTHFLFTKTNHTYRPPGAVSTYIHSLQVGHTLEFCHLPLCMEKSRIIYPLTQGHRQVQYVTLLCVGAGVAPMIQAVRSLLREDTSLQISMLYGVREVADILLRDVLEGLVRQHGHRFRLLYCVGSRYANVHMGAKAKGKGEYVPPPPPEGFEGLEHAELGWINEAKVAKHGFPPSPHSLVVVCGLPGVYDKLCGPRLDPTLEPGSVLHRLGYTDQMVVKL